MTTEIKVPKLPESVADATLVTWHKKAGDAVKRDENLADLETDKVVLEVPAPADGVLKEIRIPAGTTVTGDQLLAIFEAGAAAAAPAPAAPAAAKAEPAKAAEPAKGGSGDKLSPAVRRVVEEKGWIRRVSPAPARTVA
jgi:2-oxoglutarate dehydrogenase E2 component (dihydrolipoamide succinyltransferase)